MIWLNSRRFINYIDLMDCGGRCRISIRDKIAPNIQQLFEDRASMHRLTEFMKYVFLITECHASGTCINIREGLKMVLQIFVTFVWG